MDSSSPSAPSSDDVESLLALARDLVLDSHEAEEAAQSAWLRVASRLAGGWWFRRPYARVALRNVLRAQQRAGKHQTEPLAMYEPVDPRSPPSLLEQKEQREVLYRELGRLPRRQADAVQMRYFREMSSSEVAKRSRVPPGTVRSDLKRALDTLRERLDRRMV